MVLFGLVQVALTQAQQVYKVDTLLSRDSRARIKIIRTTSLPAVPGSRNSPNVIDKLWINGKITALPSGENYQGAAGDFLLTSKIAGGDRTYTTSLQTYTLKGGSVQPLSEKNIEETESAYFIGNKGNIVVTDEFEQLGYQIDIYSPSFQKLNGYRPFPTTAFSGTLSSFTENRTAYIFFPVEKNKAAQLTQIETNTGRILSETKLPLGKFTNLVIAGNKCLVQQIGNPYSNNQLICYNSDGKENWRIFQTADALLPVTSNGVQMAFVLDKTSYRFIDLETGKPGTTRLLSSITPGSMPEDYQLDATTSALGNDILLLVSKKSGSMTFQHDVFRIQPTGQFQKIASLPSSETIVRFSKFPDFIAVTDLSNQTLFRYEK